MKGIVKLKTNANAYESENRSLHMKERIGYGVGDFANNMVYTPVNSLFTYFLTNVAGLGAGVVGTAINLPFGLLAALMTKNQTERGYLDISKMVFAFAYLLFK